MVDIPFPFLILLASFAIVLVLVSFKKNTNDMFNPWLAIFAGIIWVVIFIPLTTSTWGYTAPPIYNVTTTYNNTTEKIQDKYYYTNSTGMITDKPDIIPFRYDIGQENYKVYIMFFGLMFMMCGAFQFYVNKGGS